MGIQLYQRRFLVASSAYAESQMMSNMLITGNMELSPMEQNRLLDFLKSGGI